MVSIPVSADEGAPLIDGSDTIASPHGGCRRTPRSPNGWTTVPGGWPPTPEFGFAIITATAP